MAPTFFQKTGMAAGSAIRLAMPGSRFDLMTTVAGTLRAPADLLQHPRDGGNEQTVGLRFDVDALVEPHRLLL